MISMLHHLICQVYGWRANNKLSSSIKNLFELVSTKDLNEQINGSQIVSYDLNVWLAWGGGPFQTLNSV